MNYTLRIKMKYSIEPRDRIPVKGYVFLKFAKNLSNKYSQNLTDTAKKLERAIQKTAEAKGDLIGNKISDKVRSVSTELHSKKSTKNLPNDETEADVERATTKKSIYHQRKDNKLLMN